MSRLINVATSKAWHSWVDYLEQQATQQMTARRLFNVAASRVGYVH